ncbi:MAG: hypothetical protein M3O22_01160 [Pseudomonadota bacterium]|nr:hypothetical protein [Pseudomonadota bacterium]
MTTEYVTLVGTATAPPAGESASDVESRLDSMERALEIKGFVTAVHDVCSNIPEWRKNFRWLDAGVQGGFKPDRLDQ